MTKFLGVQQKQLRSSATKVSGALLFVTISGIVCTIILAAYFISYFGSIFYGLKFYGY